MTAGTSKNHGPDSTQTDPSVTDSTTEAGSVLRVRLWAGARAAAERDEVTLTGVTTVAQAVGRLGTEVPALAPILEVSSLLIDGQRVEGDAAVAPGDVLEVLPPFAGG